MLVEPPDFRSNLPRMTMWLFFCLFCFYKHYFFLCVFFYLDLRVVKYMEMMHPVLVTDAVLSAGHSRQSSDRAIWWT